MSAVHETVRPLKLLIDTNVLLDYYLGRPSSLAGMKKLIECAHDSEKLILCVSSLSLKDVYFVLGRTLKMTARKEDALTDGVIAAANETAWACIRDIREFAIIAPVGADEVLDSFVFKRHHNDFEDDLILGVANRVDADYVVTGDRDLIAHAKGVCIDVNRAVELLGLFG